MWNETYCIFSRTHEIFLPEPKAAAYQQHVLYHPPTTDQTPLTLFTTRSPAANKLLHTRFSRTIKLGSYLFPTTTTKKIFSPKLKFLLSSEAAAALWVKGGQRRRRDLEGNAGATKNEFQNPNLKTSRYVNEQKYIDT